jgi:PKD repeat protein
MNPIASYTWDFGDGTSGSGSTVAHAYASSGTYTVKLTVTDVAGVSDTSSQDLNVVNNVWPTARFTVSCIGWRCTFDASASSDPDGPIANYAWDWGDGYGVSDMSAVIVTHTYKTAGPFTVTLYVTDSGGARGTQRQVVNLPANVPPVASFTATCTALTCTFDGHGSSDPDGMITSYAWSFGDNTTGSDVTASHTYASAGTYSVSLTVRDNGGATGVRTGSVTVSQPTMHVGDLDGTGTNQQSTWTALVTITLHDGNHGRVVNATVSGSWSTGGTASCITDGSGQCLVSRSAIPKNTKSVAFTIVNATSPTFLYRSVDNHDPDGDSNGTSITVSNP